MSDKHQQTERKADNVVWTDEQLEQRAAVDSAIWTEAQLKQRAALSVPPARLSTRGTERQAWRWKPGL